MDREQVSRLLGHKVAVRLTSVEARGVEIVATLEEVRDDGVVLSEVGEIGPGPTMFCPWDSLHRVRDRPPWLAPPHEELAPEEPETQEAYEVREVPAEELAPDPPTEHRRDPTARTLERVVPIAQRRSVGDITVALASLELFGEGLGVLRWRVSLGDEAFRRDPDLGFGIFEPVFEVRDGTGRALPWSPRSGGASDGESRGEAEVRELPEAGEIEVVATRLVADAYGPEGEYEGEGPSHDGPWIFRFAI
ncbi:MAG: hypothetical protein M3Q49_15890 [Actinomycetota bacterium]|nr:hypothetical protein [Actinomycetota bacterium]